jgi:hypothetical protein
MPEEYPTVECGFIPYNRQYMAKEPGYLALGQFKGDILKQIKGQIKYLRSSLMLYQIKGTNKFPI